MQENTHDDDKPSEVSEDMKNSLRKHLKKAMNLLQGEQYHHCGGIINILYDFATEVDKLKLYGRSSSKRANLLRQ